MMFGSYRTVYGGQPRMAQQPSGGYTGVSNPWLLEPGTTRAHRLKLVPATRPAQIAGTQVVPVAPRPKHRMPPPPPTRKIRPAGQASSGPSPWFILGVVGVGLVGYELIKYAVRHA